MTRVTVLTPAGRGAIAVLAVTGPQAWSIVNSTFRPASGKPLPAHPTTGQFWYGTLGQGAGDEVVVVCTASQPQLVIEIHCHGGPFVVGWLLDELRSRGAVEVVATPVSDYPDPRAVEPLTRASTLRTASILLDQAQGAFQRAVATILNLLEQENLDEARPRLERLARFAPLGRHLVDPWIVGLVGVPNVGKSSLMNALAGFQRSIVAPIPGTTRDVVTARLALDGWPVLLADTAGLRDGTDGLEQAGIDRSRSWATRADVLLLVASCDDPASRSIPLPATLTTPRIAVLNKIDQSGEIAIVDTDWFPVSALTAEGIAGLAAQIVRVVVPQAPDLGEAVPFTPVLADLTLQAFAELTSGSIEHSIAILRDLHSRA